MSTTVAQHLIDSLVAAGVRRIYGIVGDSLNPVADAVRTTEGIDWVHVHNEEAAAFAAAAEAQLTGRLAVCAGSCGPGNLHLVQGLFDADRNAAPVLAIASHIPTTQVGTTFFQETHPEALFAECSRYCETVTGAGQFQKVLRTAMQTALGESGVSVLVLPGDVGGYEIDEPHPVGALVAGPSAPVPPADQVDRLVELLDAARTVTLFVGSGARDARPEVLQLAEVLGAPMGHSFGGKEFFQYDNPYDVGMSGLLGYGACTAAMHEADLLLLLGTDFPYEAFLPQARTVQVDRAAGHLGRRTPLELGVCGDVGATLREVLPRLRRDRDRGFLDRMLHRHAEALEGVVAKYTKDVDHLTPVHPEFAAVTLDELAAQDAIFTVDTGMCNVWAARYLTPTAGRRVIGSFRHGSMANALPHAIGAQLSHPGRQVVSVSGDGGLSMLMGELLTVREHDLPVKIVVFNNGSLAMVRLEMLVQGYPFHETDHGPVDYAAIARACGIHAVAVDEPKRLRDALRDALDRPGPALVDVRTDPNALSLPPHVTGEQITGFTRAAARAVMSGGVGHMVDLARSNLRNIPRVQDLRLA